MAYLSLTCQMKNSNQILKMPETRVVVINTTPLIALSAAMGSLDVLKTLYDRVIVPKEVVDELYAGGSQSMGLVEFQAAHWIERRAEDVRIVPYVRNTLDRGEAAVIQTAMDEKIERVCIDEVVGRRVARLCGLTLTGSIGVLIKARSLGYPVSMRESIERMREHGIWLSESVVQFALAHNQA